MIIDAHTHIGDFVKISMPEDVFLASLDKYNIDFALCSCGSAVEVDHDQNPIPDEDQVTLLWKREMITGCYLPTWCQLDLDDGRTVNAIVFIMDPRHPEYESDTRAQVIAPLIAAASGPLGTNAQYLFSLEQELIKLGMQDDGLNDLLVSVKKLLAENYPDGVLRPGFA